MAFEGGCELALILEADREGDLESESVVNRNKDFARSMRRLVTYWWRLQSMERLNILPQLYNG